MRQIVECVPNFSEGRRTDVIEAIVGAIREASVRVLDTHSDPDHNRTVVTFVGEPDAVVRAAVAGARVAAAQIDMTAHSGVHPRIGATDVIPVIPIAGVTMDQCIALAERIGSELAGELGLPVYLYARAAKRPERQWLPTIRRGGYEGLAERIADDPAAEPDYGPAELGPAGATAVGARPPLIAFNAVLDTDRLATAEAVARAVRGSSGGFGDVQARGFDLTTQGRVQVSLNILDHARAPLGRVLETVRREAARHGAMIAHTEVVGLVPQSALVDTAAWYLQTDGFSSAQVLETRVFEPAAEEEVADLVPRAFLEALASDAPTPGGGAAAALAGALAAALNGMVARLTVGRDRYATVEDEMRQLAREADALRAELLDLMVRDSTAFEAVMRAYRLPRSTTDEQQARREAIQAALHDAIEAPLEIMRRGVAVLELAEAGAENGNANAVTDCGVAGHLAQAAVQSASLNVEINVIGLRDLSEGDRYRRESAELRQRADALNAEIDRIVRGRIAK